jgi:hypothetical protein
MLRRDASGNYFCPDEGAGKDATTLNNEIAACAARPSPRVRPMDAPPVRSEVPTFPVETKEAALRRVFGK